VNGKLRARVAVASDASRKAAEEAALANENVQRFIEDRAIVNVIVVPGRLVNVVVK
jgi:leucyl-tRNA synthetase